VPSKKEKLPLSVTHPELAKEADGWDPKYVSRWSKKKFNWKCNLGHSWSASAESRTHLHSSCPDCAGVRLLKGSNDLASQFPLIARQAFGWDPSCVSKRSGKVLEWRCEYGHIWKSSVQNRTKRNDGCSVCSGRSVLAGFNDLETLNPELAKQLVDTDPSTISKGSHKKFLWSCQLGHTWIATVKNRDRGNTGCPFCSGKKVLVGFNDLATTHPQLAIELVNTDPRTVSKGISKKIPWKCSLGHVWETTPAHRIEGNECPFCQGKKVLVGFNDLATTHPEIAMRLVDIDPTTISKGSNRKLKWKCELGHTFMSVLSTILRSSSSGCPYCHGLKVLVGFNDLATTHPNFAKNAYGWDPTLFTAGSNKKVKWICSKKHVWSAVVASVTSNSSNPGNSNFGCPTCAKSGFDPNQDGFLYLLIQESWDMYQIGITNIPDDRLSRHKRLGWELLELRGPMDGHLTQQWETAILRMLKAKGADLSNSKIAGKFDGYSEAWSKTTFEVTSIKELMRLTDEFEDTISR
jgi:hypothetical protein